MNPELKPIFLTIVDHNVPLLVRNQGIKRTTIRNN